jgi:hypothetical protein
VVSVSRRLTARGGIPKARRMWRGQMALVGETGGQRNLRDRHLLPQEERLCQLHPALDDVLMHGHLHRAAEESVQMRRTHAGRKGCVGHRVFSRNLHVGRTFSP